MTANQTIATERELVRNGIEIPKRLASEEAEWYTSSRLRDFSSRFKKIFASGQIV